MVQIPAHPIEDARRYMENARTILSEKAGKDGNLYTDKNMYAWPEIPCIMVF